VPRPLLWTDSSCWCLSRGWWFSWFLGNRRGLRGRPGCSLAGAAMDPRACSPLACSNTHAARMHEDAKRATGQEIDRLKSSGRSENRWSLHRQPLPSRGHAALTPPAWACWPINKRAKRHCPGVGQSPARPPLPLPLPCHGGVCYAATPPDSCAMLPLPFGTTQAASHGWMLPILLGPFLGVYSSAVWSARFPATLSLEPASYILVVAVSPWRGRRVWCRGSYKQCSVMPCPRCHCWCLPVIASRA
jgi:hypothetical protein